MVRTFFASVVCLLAAGLAALDAGSARAADPIKPNIVFLLCDDLGYGDVSCFGQTKFRTPNVDRLAAERMRLTVHYSGSAVCAPSRMLHPHVSWPRPARAEPLRE